MGGLQPVDGDCLLSAAVVDDEGLVVPAEDSVRAGVGCLERVAVRVVADEDVRGNG